MGKILQTLKSRYGRTNLSERRLPRRNQEGTKKPGEVAEKMLSRGWWSLSPSSRWLEESDETSSGVWSLTKQRDPLAARALITWGDEYANESAVSKCGNSDALLKEHLRINGKVVRTRFPPEPNGYLHIGHAKSMNMNFSLAFNRLEAAAGKIEKRETVFRYDDTNPDKESEEFVESLRKDVAWLGWNPVRTTHTSDYFECLCAMAIELNLGPWVEASDRERD